MVERHGDVDVALEEYYESSLGAVCGRFGLREGRLRRWFESSLITVAGTRAIAFRDAETTAGMPNAVLEMLDEIYLVRSEIRGDDVWYELSHDRFVLPITRANARWRNLHQGQRVRGDRLETAAKEWQLSGRARAFLLPAAEARAAADWLRSGEADEFGVSETVRGFVQASQSSAATRRLHRQLGGIAATVLAASLLAVWFFRRSAASAEGAKWEAWGEVATQMASDPGKEFESLAWGIRAVGEALRQGHPPPAGAVAGLRAAMAVVGDTRWLRGGAGSPVAGTLSPDGRLAVIVDVDTVRLFDAVTGEVRAARGADPGYNWTAAQFYDDGRTLVALQRAQPRGLAATDATPQKYWVADAATGRELQATRRRVSGGSQAAFARRAGIAVIYGHTRPAEVYHLREGLRHRFRGTSTGWRWATLSPTGSHLVALREESFEIWDVAAGEMVLRRPRRSPGSAVFSADGRYALTFSTASGFAAQVWALPATPGAGAPRASAPSRPALVREIELPLYVFTSPQFTRDGSVVLVGMDTVGTQKVLVTGPLKAPQRQTLYADTARVRLVEARVVQVFSGPGDVRVAVSDPVSGDTLGVLPVRQEVADVHIDGSGGFVLTLGRDNTGRVWPLGPTAERAEETPRELVRSACAKIRSEREYTRAVALICERFRGST